MILLALAAVALADCEDPRALVDATADAVIEARFDEVEDLARRAEAAFGCSGLADPQLLARLFLMQGAWMTIEGARDDATFAFAAAHSIAPDVWVEDLGTQLRQEYTRAVERMDRSAASGELRIDPEPEGFAAALNGTILEFPTPAPAGLHLVQVVEPDGTAHFARVVLVPPGATVTVETGPLTVPLTEASVPAAARRPFPTLLVAGGTAAVLAGGSALGAVLQRPAMEEATTTAALDAAFARQRLFAYASYGFMGLAAAGVTLHFVF